MHSEQTLVPSPLQLTGNQAVVRVGGVILALCPGGIVPGRMESQRDYEIASDGGGEHWAVLASPIEPSKMNDIDSQAYSDDVITRIIN